MNSRDGKSTWERFPRKDSPPHNMVPHEPASLWHIFDSELHGNLAHICHHASQELLTRAGVSGWRRRNGLVSQAPSTSWGHHQPHLFDSLGESVPGPLQELHFVFINPLSLLAIRALRKPQPGLFIGQGHPWGKECVHSHSPGAKCKQGSQLAQATRGVRLGTPRLGCIHPVSCCPAWTLGQASSYLRLRPGPCEEQNCGHIV